MRLSLRFSIRTKLLLCGFLLLGFPATFGAKLLAACHAEDVACHTEALIAISLPLVFFLALVIISDIFLPMRQMVLQLTRAAQDPDNVETYTIKNIREDEVGLAQRAMNDMFLRMSRNMRNIRDVNAQAGRRLAAIEASRDGVYMVDAQGRLVYANQAYRDLHLFDADFEPMGAPWLSFYTGAARDVLKNSSLDIMHQDGFWYGEITITSVQKNKQIFEVSLTMLEDGGFIGNERDVSARKISDIEKAELQQLLAQSQKMEAVGRLTGGIAHDFNNMLAIITGNMDMIEDDLPESAQAREYLNAAQRAAFRGAELTQRLLSFSRRQVLSPRVLHFHQFIPDALTLFSRAINETIMLDVTVAADTWPVNVDAGQLENALLNLVINASDAMPRGGSISIRADNVSLGEKESLLRGVPVGPYVILSVTDTGHGIPADVLARVFEPFFTTKDVGVGTGLGLSMVYGFAKQSGGYVVIDSTENVGTCVAMYFPRCDADASAKEVSLLKNVHNDSADMVLGTVVIAEDDPDVLTITGSRLERMGYTIHTARNGTEAMELMLRLDKVDLLLTDVVMPGGIDGPALAARTREVFPDIRVLFLSGNMPHEGILEPFPDGVASYLSKPYTQQKLADEIKVLTRGVHKRRTA